MANRVHTPHVKTNLWQTGIKRWQLTANSVDGAGPETNRRPHRVPIPVKTFPSGQQAPLCALHTNDVLTVTHDARLNLPAAKRSVTALSGTASGAAPSQRTSSEALTQTPPPTQNAGCVLIPTRLDATEQSLPQLAGPRPLAF